MKFADTAKGAYDGPDQERRLYYDASWRLLEEHIDDDFDTTFSEDRRAQQVWGARYIDDAVLRRVDADADGDWTDAETQLRYYLTDALFSVRALPRGKLDLITEWLGRRTGVNGVPLAVANSSRVSGRLPLCSDLA